MGTNDEHDAVALAQTALRALVAQEPERHPLVIGLVAPLGTPLDQAADGLKPAFERYTYVTEVVHMSRLLDEVPNAPWLPLPTTHNVDYYTRRMDAGNELRVLAQSGSALAVLAVGRIAQIRASDSDPKAILLRSLKHPDEVKLLRHIYGNAFTLLAVSSPAEEIRENLATALGRLKHSRSEAELLIERDESESLEKSFGQNVRDTFSMADMYLEIRRGVPVADELDRIVDSLFGAPFLTPRPGEEAMKLASDASFRSASLGRQVGAVLIPSIGTPMIVGTNEVPKPGGGQFWDGDEPDHRDFQMGEDSNPVYIRLMLQDLLERLATRPDLLNDEMRGKTPEELYEVVQQKDADGGSALDGTRARALIEFMRCVHAEQAAIINAARSGVSTQGAALYCTTFPCHECTKMIVAAGITEVVYIEPYAKSLAGQLYVDLIEVQPPAGRSSGLANGKVPFRAFVGIAPSRYEVAFKAGDRKVGELPRALNPLANPRTTGWHAGAVSDREDLAIASLNQVLSSRLLRPTQQGPIAEPLPIPVESPPASGRVRSRKAGDAS